MLIGDNSKQKSSFNILIGLSLLEGLLTIISLILIPTDPKNAILGRYSLSRLVLLGTSLILLGIQVFLFTNSSRVLKILERLIVSKRLIQWIKWFGILTAICLWLTIWFDANRLGIMSASYIRIKPLLLWIELIIFQFYVYVKLVINEINLRGIILPFKRWDKILKIILITIVIGVGLFALLRILKPGDMSGQLIFQPGAPLSALQLFFSWIFFIGLFLLERRSSGFYDKKGWAITTFLLLWVSAFIIWNSVPLACTDDRPGPYLPNNQCYASVNDAVYSIGSHYITLGQGINNHWMTDKPLYMVFLAIGEWIAGPRIDQYLIFQVAVLSLIPVLLYVLGKKFSGYAGGVFLAVLAILSGINEIKLYRLVGGVNAKLENPELLTALFLILLCFCVIKWWNQPNKLVWAAFSGGMLGASSLLRLNPLFIAPVLLFVAIVSGWKRGKSLFGEIAVFLICFTLVFSPMILSMRDSQGNNYFFAKVQGVIAERYSINQTMETPLPAQSLQITSPTNTPAEILANNLQNELAFSPAEITQNDGSSIFIHFLNNEYSSIALLPINFTFISISDQVKQPIWDLTSPKPIWESGLSFENILVLVFNFSMIMLGIFASVKKLGLAGISACLIQIGYHIGNAFAKTSGDRYLQPVKWVTLLYFSIGIVTLSFFIFKILQSRKNGGITQPQKVSTNKTQNQLSSKKQLVKLTGVIVLFLVVGLLVPLMNHLPSVLPEEMNNDSNQLAAAKLESNNSISAEQWQMFIQDPNHLIVQGKAYSARYYRSNFYRSGDLSFELMLLGKEHVFVSYLLGAQPNKTFTDGSDVILVGCKLSQDNKWAASRIILRSYAIIQLDHEQSVYVDPTTNWICEN